MKRRNNNSVNLQKYISENKFLNAKNGIVYQFKSRERYLD